MNPITFPIILTAIMLVAVYFDLRDGVPKNCKKIVDWAILGLALLIKPGLFIAVVWWLFLTAF